MPEIQVAEKPKTNAAIRPKAQQAAKLSAFGLSEYKYARFSYTLPVGWTFKQCLDPEFWVHCCHILQKDVRANDADKTGAVIEVRTQDHEWYAELYVRAVQERGLVVSVLREPVRVAPQDKANGETGEFKKRWVGGKSGYYQIVRMVDGAIVSSGNQLKTKEQAWDFIDKMKAG